MPDYKWLIHHNILPWKKIILQSLKKAPHCVLQSNVFYNLMSHQLVNLCIILFVALIKMRLASLTSLYWRNLPQCGFVHRNLLQHHFPLKSVPRLLKRVTQWFWRMVFTLSCNTAPLHQLHLLLCLTCLFPQWKSHTSGLAWYNSNCSYC